MANHNCYKGPCSSIFFCELVHGFLYPLLAPESTSDYWAGQKITEVEVSADGELDLIGFASLTFDDYFAPFNGRAEGAEWRRKRA